MRLPLALIGCAIIATGLAGLASLLALSPLRRAITALDSAVSAVHASNATAAVADLRVARADFATAAGRLDTWWATPGTWVPGVRPQLLAARAAASVGDEVSTTGVALAPQVRLAGLSFGPPLLRRLGTLQTSLTSADAVLAHASHALEAVRSSWLLPPLAQRLAGALHTLTSATHDARLATATVTAARQLLGGDGTQHLFLAIDTNAELRPGGGVVGNYGLIIGSGGHLHLARFGRDGQLNAAGRGAARALVAPRAYRALASYINPQIYWQNVLATPQFPLDARAIAGLYPESGGTPLTGVIAVNPTGLADLLSLIGPVSVPSWPQPITTANAPAILLNEEYSALSGTNRYAFLGEVAATVWSRLTSGGLPGLSTVAHALATAVADKDIVLWSKNPATEKALVAVGAAGVLRRPAGGDFLGVINTNDGGNKLDYYLRRAITDDVRLGPGGQVNATVRVTLTNLAPTSGLVPYVGNSVAEPNAPSGTNTTDLSLYTPFTLLNASLNGAPALLTPESLSGLTAYTTQVVLPPGGSATLVAHLSGSLPHPADYRLRILRQATVAPDALQLRVTLPPHERVGTTSGGLRADGPRAATGAFSLSRDLTVSVTAAR